MFRERERERMSENSEWGGGHFRWTELIYVILELHEFYIVTSLRLKKKHLTNYFWSLYIAASAVR